MAAGDANFARSGVLDIGTKSKKEGNDLAASDGPRSLRRKFIVNNTIKLTLFLLAAIAIAGCQKAANNSTANTTQNKVNAENSNAVKHEEPAKTDTASAGSLATPANAYKTAYAAREKKDYEGLKRTLSKDVLGFLSDIGESEHKTLEEEIKQMFDRPQAKTAEVRNEKITGTTAVLEYLDETGGWKWMDFVKEGDDWKLTLPNEKTSDSEGPAKKKGGK